VRRVQTQAVRSSSRDSEPAAEREASSFVDAAVESCRRRGLNLTPIRRRVLEVMAASPVPISAYAVIHRLSDAKLLGPPTVYRALEFLEKAGFVRHLALRKAYVRCDLAPETPTSALLLCTTCGAVAETSSPEMGATIDRLTAQAGFELGRRPIEIEGRCASCCRTNTA
jgi:Fur family transcriptional regulator, zinc uptake regulator